jgi:hypothetical protein
MIVDYLKTLTLQGGTCAICKSYEGKGKRMLIDHDHKTGKIRGILCSHCNFALGFSRDNPEILAKMIEYIKNGGSGSEIVYYPKRLKSGLTVDYSKDIISRKSLRYRMKTELVFGPRKESSLASVLQSTVIEVKKEVAKNPETFTLLDGKITLKPLISVCNKERSQRSQKIEKTHENFVDLSASFLRPLRPTIL